MMRPTEPWKKAFVLKKAFGGSLMLDRVIAPIALGEAPERRDARDLVGALRDAMHRFLRLLRRLIEAGGPLS
jgi:hypothetical protein